MLLRHRIHHLHGLSPVMASKLFLHFKSTPPSSSTTTSTYLIHNLFSFRFPSNSHPKLLPFSLKPSHSSFSTHASIPRPVPEVDTLQLKQLKLKLEGLGIDCRNCRTGQTYGLLCPMCKGEKKLSLFIAGDGNAAMWNCFRAKCRWRGSTHGSADVRSSYNKMNKMNKGKKIREITVQQLNLVPLCSDLREYFAERMISEETLRRNCVMQRRYDDQIVIAFTYKRKGELISCKYRDPAKKFWQESDTEKILYGLDDIEGASDVIIVEGEMDKLAMEEAGFRNCVSVPDGAPPQVSAKDLPSQDKDIKYQYLWNCKEYLGKASRIILATDGDAPGQALAEELARRLGRERCWRVRWPSKNEKEHYKDANEVLMFLGPAVLRKVIESAELYPIKGLFNF